MHTEHVQVGTLDMATDRIALAPAIRMRERALRKVAGAICKGSAMTINIRAW
jgi:hypothetical protein